MKNCYVNKRLPNIFSWLPAFVLSCIFLIGGIGKLFKIEGFFRSVYGYGILPKSMVAPLSLSLILIEIIIGVGLWIKQVRNAAALLAVIICLIFLIFLVYGYYHNANIDCGCFLFLSKEINFYHILLDIAMLLLSLSIAFDRAIK